MNKRAFIPFHVPAIGDEEIDDVVQTLRSGWLTTGPKTAAFEEDFRRYTGAPHALAVNSCTAGLHLALAALEIGPGDEVITTPLTFCATVTTIIHVGATPVLADVGPDGNVDPEAIAACITDRTRAIIPVHFAGLPCDMEPIWRLAHRRGIYVIEDAAHAVGARLGSVAIGGGDPTSGTCSDAVAFSFYATKNLTTGEGGMVTTPRKAIADRMRILCLHGISRDAWDRYSEHGKWHYDVIACGFKYNLSDVQSAIGIQQLRKLERFIAVRTQLARTYTRAFLDVEELEVPPERPGCRHAWHLYTLRLNLNRLNIDRDQFMVELRRHGIGASVHFIPVPLHSFYRPYVRSARMYCRTALALYPRLVSLPLYPGLSEDQMTYITSTVKQIISTARKDRVFAASAVRS